MKVGKNFSSIKELKYGAKMLSLPEEEVAISVNQLVELSQVYNAAIKEISTKLEILDEEFKVKHDHNPIHHMESRLKRPYSIMEKLDRKGYDSDFSTAMEYIYDIAGVRVICPYVKDIYHISDLLLRQDDITLIKEKDYIKSPKINGYRSLHLVVSVPVFLSEMTKHVPVEVQIRTIAMDFWASLEHKLKYKSDSNFKEEIERELVECANQVAEVDLKMQEIHEKIHK
ncbi:MAG: GTP pyrophosphokinase family protein [Lachnospirales bacterium]